MIRYFLFDLDDTLYPQSAGIMREISARMNEYMIARVRIAPDEVTQLRQDYWTRFGTTLRGLYLERGVDPQDFLNYVHAVPVEQYIQRDKRLDAMLAAFPQAKCVFTNAPEDYARRILVALGIEKHFAHIFDINFLQYESKPNRAAYPLVLNALSARGDECAMIDDNLRNLVPAKELGIRTVYLRVDGRIEGGDGADIAIDSIYELEKISF